MRKLVAAVLLISASAIATARADTIRAVQLGCHSFTFSTATGFPTIDAGATFAAGSVETNNVRYRDDGTAPTASVGVQIQAGANFYFSENLSNMSFIPVTGSATINYCDYR